MNAAPEHEAPNASAESSGQKPLSKSSAVGCETLFIWAF